VAYARPAIHFQGDITMAQNKVSMPSSGAGITRYFDDYKSKIEFKPGHVIVMTIIVMIVVILLHIYGQGILGM